MELPSSGIDEEGFVDEELAEHYIDAVMERFGASPEGLAVFDEYGDLGWAAAAMDYGMRFLGVDLATMRRGDIEEVLLDIFPRKVSCSPKAAPEIVAELRALWRFARRVTSLPFASECLALLDHAGLVNELQRALADTSKYGMAKSFVMQGRGAGYDMTKQADLAAFQRVYNEANFRRIEQQDAGQRPALGARSAGPSSDARKARRHKRKMQKRSRKRNR